jgi:hypothetical protein
MTAKEKSVTMLPALSAAAISRLDDGLQALVSMYTDTAVLFNACDVAAKHYAARTDDMQLSTTHNIPLELRLPVELDVVFHRTELPGHYAGPALLERLCNDFVVRLIAVVDGVLEDIYEESLPLVNPAVTAPEVAKQVRSSWALEANGHPKVMNFLIDHAHLRPPAEKTSTIQMVFDRYAEMREIRHALVHTAGVLSSKHLARLQELSLRLPPPLRTASLAAAPFLTAGRVALTLSEILVFRRWAYTTLGYLRLAFQQSVHPPAAMTD